ncbi:hypothetical protein GCM10009839_84250 [Catenulispora yoronensis]|uniref:Uncharacterized protein n=1 Tax=Catenulispora yoronensis TaxID=450799 RepID=A0ABN2VEK7_9ACTN
MRRGDEVPRPHPWSVRVKDRRAALGWRELLACVPDNLDRAWVAMTGYPRGLDGRQHRLKGDKASVFITEASGLLEQWQYEVTGGGRIWYAIDDLHRTLWITEAGTGHPGQTDSRGRRR